MATELSISMFFCIILLNYIVVNHDLILTYIDWLYIGKSKIIHTFAITPF
jgi:hypothetical protein